MKKFLDYFVHFVLISFLGFTLIYSMLSDAHFAPHLNENTILLMKIGLGVSIGLGATLGKLSFDLLIKNK